MLHAPVHEIFGDFVSFVFYLVLGFREDEPLLALELLPTAGALGTLGLSLGQTAHQLVAEAVDGAEFPTCHDDRFARG